MEQILLTESGTHAVDLLCRFLLKPGDCVLVDDPSYFNYHALLKAHQVQAIGVPYAQRPGPGGVRASPAGAFAAAVHHQFRPAQPDRRGAFGQHRTACWAWPNAAN
jgi:aspartate/methionine/tyrosine aminotransferase